MNIYFLSLLMKISLSEKSSILSKIAPIVVVLLRLWIGVGCGKAAAIRTDSGPFRKDERQTFRSK